MLEDMHPIRIILPEITFTDRIILFKGTKEVHLVPVGSHTEATTVVYLPPPFQVVAESRVE
jgi:hypothetical protein